MLSSTPRTSITYRGNGTLNQSGNPETPFSASYNAANRMTAITLNPNSLSGFTPAALVNPATIYTLTYDNNGNLTTRQNTSPVSPGNPNPTVNPTEDTTTYTWDARNRLTQIQSNGSSAAYQYDAMGRRTQRNITQAGSAAQITTYLYDGLQAVGELKAQAGATPAQSTAFTTGLAIDEVIARYTTIQPSAGNPQVQQQARAYLTDALGTVMQQVREDQSTLNSYAYSPYGQSAAAGADEGNSVQYTARENDGVGGTGDGGIYFYRNRYFDKVLMRFISEDPIGLAGGGNSYAYVNGDPVSGSDPLGLWWPGIHNSITYTRALEANMPLSMARELGDLAAAVDGLPGSQLPANSDWHGMSDPDWKGEEEAKTRFSNYVNKNLNACTLDGLARALHAIQDSFAPAHRGFQNWGGLPAPTNKPMYIAKWIGMAVHGIRDGPLPWNFSAMRRASKATATAINDWQAKCLCRQ